MRDFVGKTKVQVLFQNGRAYFRTKSGSVQITKGLRMRLRGKGLYFNDIYFPWSCSYSVAEEILSLNASLKADSGEIEYLNESPEHFYRVCGSEKTYKTLCKECVKAFVAGSAQLEHMVTNSKETDTNMLGQAIPILRCGHIYVQEGQEGRIYVDGLSEQEIRIILTHVMKLKDDSSLGEYGKKWVDDILISALGNYILGLKLSNEEIEEILGEYTMTVEKVNNLLKQHIEEFDFSDEAVFRFDCGDITIGFTDAGLRQRQMILNNDSRTQNRTPQICLPKFVQSLTVQRREFENAQRIVKRELGLNIKIVHSELD